MMKEAKHWQIISYTEWSSLIGPVCMILGQHNSEEANYPNMQGPMEKTPDGSLATQMTLRVMRVISPAPGSGYQLLALVFLL